MAETKRAVSNERIGPLLGCWWVALRVLCVCVGGGRGVTIHI